MLIVGGKGGYVGRDGHIDDPVELQRRIEFGEGLAQRRGDAGGDEAAEDRPRASTWTLAGTPPGRCQPAMRWLGNSFLPPGRGNGSTCSASGSALAKPPMVAGSSGPRANPSATIPPMHVQTSNLRQPMS